MFPYKRIKPKLTNTLYSLSQIKWQLLTEEINSNIFLLLPFIYLLLFIWLVLRKDQSICVLVPHINQLINCISQLYTKFTISYKSVDLFFRFRILIKDADLVVLYRIQIDIVFHCHQWVIYYLQEFL